jgi:hypothetical protein
MPDIPDYVLRKPLRTGGPVYLEYETTSLLDGVQGGIGVRWSTIDEVHSHRNVDLIRDMAQMGVEANTLAKALKVFGISAEEAGIRIGDALRRS